jgi:hypothetical protein
MADAERRDEAYERLLGSDFDAYVDDQGKPKIEARRYSATPVTGGPLCDVWVTSGMSDAAMTGEDGEPFRRELIFYAPPGGDYARPLIAVAQFPFENATSLDHSHSIQMFGAFFVPGGAEALLADEPLAVELPHVFLLSPLIRRHQRLNDELVIQGSPVEFLWVVPISAAEHTLKKRHGASALLDVFEAHKHPWLFDPERKSYVK